MIKDYIVIGAGISGINTAKILQEAGLGKPLLLEKSRGIGGRMATRRTLNTKFDHGAQFYKLRSDILNLHNVWLEKKITNHWFVSDKGDHWSSPIGMTSLAKSMIENIDIALEKQISVINFENNLWKITSNTGEKWLCKNLIVSSPLPQTIKLLEEVDRNIFFNKNVRTELAEITYTKALIGLIVTEENLDINTSGYQEFAEGDIFSISDQKKKGLSELSALTVTMSPEFSESVFDNLDEDIMAKMTKSILNIFPKIKIKEFELKKWRYCKANTRFKDYFLEISPKLYLIGDAFGGPSLSGALRSSNALCNYLIKENSGKKV